MTENLMTLIEQLQHNDANTRSEAVLTLGKMRHAEAVDALIWVLCHDPEIHVQEDVTWALVRMGDTAIAPLIQVMSDSNATVRHNAAHTLGKIGDKRATDTLISALHDGNDAVRLKATFALGQIGDTQAVLPLVNLLGDDSYDVHLTVADVLEGFGQAAIPPLTKAMTNDNWRVREPAVEILGRIGTPETVAPLLLALQDESWQVRFTAVSGLREIGDTQAIVPLQQLIDDENPHVRVMVAAALDVLGRT